MLKFKGKSVAFGISETLILISRNLRHKGATAVAFGAWSAHILGHGAIHLPLVGAGARVCL